MGASVAMKHLRTLSTRSLVVVVVVVVAAIGAAFAVAAGGGGPTPAPKPLDRAIHDALGAPEPAGITARIEFTNKLFPSGALTGQVGSALMSGASGRLWATADGRGRLELQSNAGDVQIVWNDETLTVYDASSNTVYKTQLPQHEEATAAPSLSAIDTFLHDLGLHAAISAAQPTNVAGQPAYDVSLSPKRDGGLLGSAALAWDAARGVPLRLAVYALGSSAPVLELTATQISYGAVAASDVEVAPPSDAKVVTLGHGVETPNEQGHAAAGSVTGLAAVRAAAGFPITAPETLAGRPRMEVRLLRGDTALVVYGKGLGSIVVAERKADAKAMPAQLGALPSVSLDGATAHELSTQLGTVLAWQSGGVTYLLAGSVPAATAETAAKALR